MPLPDWLWIILIGALVAISCGLVGSFLVLRRMAMLGDAISHAVLPGIALAFLLTGSRNSWIMLLGAGVLGMVTAFLVQILTGRGGVRNDAAIGVTFTSLFAVGVILISRFASKVDLDTDCVLYGVLELAPLNTLTANGRDWGPYAFWQMLAVTVACAIFVIVFFKELKITSFDPELATSLGISATVMHYALMGMVSVVTVGSFEPVGAILVVAMLVVPPATAYLLTHDLKAMLWLSCLLGVGCSVFGYLLSHAFNVSAAGSMSAVAGVFFLGAFLFSPSQGLVSKRLARRNLSRGIVREDALQTLWRVQEKAPGQGLSLQALAARQDEKVAALRSVLSRLVSDRLVRVEGGEYFLTETGGKTAQELVHRHRVYESFLEELGYPRDHQHAAADRIEHFLSPNLTESIDEAAGNPVVDPHGREIPH